MISKHEQRLFNKIKAMDQSRIPKFPVNTYVRSTRPMWDPHTVGLVDRNTGTGDYDDPAVCHVWFDERTQLISERDLRRATTEELLWFRHPKKGHMMIGRNRALPILIWAAIMLAGSVASVVGAEGVWRWFWPIVSIISFTLVILHSIWNIQGKTH